MRNEWIETHKDTIINLGMLVLIPGFLALSGIAILSGRSIAVLSFGLMASTIMLVLMFGESVSFLSLF